MLVEESVAAAQTSRIAKQGLEPTFIRYTDNMTFWRFRPFWPRFELLLRAHALLSPKNASGASRR